MIGKERHILRYAFGLDGLRAIAVMAVIFYHLGFNWAKGGFLGVDIFFVLSGYLITSVLLSQKRLSLSQFLVGRIRRLLPAAYVMILITVAWAILFHRSSLTTLRGDALSSFFYVSNWWFIFHKVSYFDSFGSPSPLKNLWSLSIEEQFYMIWPIILIGGLRFIQKQKVVILIGALLSAVLMALLYKPGTDPSRIYYGTDTRSFSLLIGCWLSFLWPLRKLSSRKLPDMGRNILNTTGFLSLLIFACCIFFINVYQSFLYRGGMLLICLNAAVLVACVSHPSSFLSDVLSWKAFRWLGTRSYGLYLWHYPIIVLTTPVIEIGHPVLWHACLQVAAMLGIAELSYRFVEMPIRKHGFKYYFYQYRLKNILKWHDLSLLKKVVVISSVFLFILYTSDIINFVATPKLGNQTTLHVAYGKEDDHDITKQLQKKSKAKENKGFVKEETTPKDSGKTLSISKKYDDVLAIGDSVLLDIAPELKKTNPNMTIDGKVGRQLTDALPLASKYKKFNATNYAVIIELGTNGYFTDEQLDTLISYFSKSHIYLINTRVPRPWENEVNRILNQIAKKSVNTALIDWYSVGIQHPEYFTPDGVHLNPQGARVLASLIDKKIHSNNSGRA